MKKMTFDEYIKNPSGGSSVWSHKEMYDAMYKDKLGKIMLREGGETICNFYRDKDERYLIHIKVPSEKVSKFYYDTVIEFTTDQESLKSSNSLKDYYVRFYSNDPWFVFTFAHAMNKNGLFISDLSPVMSKKALEEKAKEKNEKDEIGYVKSLYFAYLIMKTRGFFSKYIYKSSGSRYNKKQLLAQITPADKKIQERQEKGEEADAEKAKKKKLERAKKEREKKESNKRNTSSTTSSSRRTTTSTRAKTKTTSKTNRAKKAKRI